MKTIIPLIFFLFIASSSTDTPKDIVDAFSKSYAHEHAGAYDRAIQVFDEVYDAGSYPMALRIGWLHYLNGDHRQSESYYQQAISLAPSSIEAMLGYVQPLAATGKWQEVVTIYQKILNIDPNNSVVNYRLALIYTNQKEYAKALPYVQKVTALYPFGYDGQLLLARIEIGRGNIMEAKKALLICLQFSPSAKEALGVVGACKMIHLHSKNPSGLQTRRV